MNRGIYTIFIMSIDSVAVIDSRGAIGEESWSDGMQEREIKKSNEKEKI